MQSLFEIATEYQLTVLKLDEMELDDQCIADTLESLSGNLQEKCTNVAKFVLNTEANAENIKAAAGIMLARAAVAQNRADRVREYLKGQMERTGVHKIECPWFVLAIKKNPPKVEITDEAAVPRQYWSQKPPPPATLDKVLIKAVISVDPSKCPGAKLVQGTRLEIK